MKTHLITSTGTIMCGRQAARFVEHDALIALAKTDLKKVCIACLGGITDPTVFKEAEEGNDES